MRKHNNQPLLRKTLVWSGILGSLLTLSPISAVAVTSAQESGVHQSNNFVKGVVVDASGIPIIGATVMVKGTASTGTITDFDGNFSLSLPSSKETLVVSYIGYLPQELEATAGQDLRIVLKEDVQELQEVQVVAYGTQSKVSVTGSMSSVRTEDLLKVPSASVTNALAGTMTGVSAVQSLGQPGMDEATLYIRGSSTLNDANATPLILVDGVERSFSQLDPNEIADITVLKDASATAVFGVRGANGVILVTTRRGAKGKASISISSNFSLQMPTRLIENADSYTTALLYNEKLDNDQSSKARFSDYALNAFKTGSDPIIYPNTDWRDLIFDDTYMQTQHNINISGGSDRVKYFTSLSYLHQDGMLKEFKQLDYDNQFAYDRFNYRANLDVDVTKTTQMKVNMGGVVGIRKEPRGHNDGLWRQVNWAAPFAGPGLSADGHPIVIGNGYLPVATKNGFLSFYGLGNKRNTNNTLNLDVSLKQDLKAITKGLSAQIKGSYDTSYSFSVNRNSNIQQYSANYEGQLTQPGLPMDDPEYNKNVVYKVTGTNQYLAYSEGYSKARNWYLEGSLNYNRTFNKVHKVSALLLYNQNRVYYPSSNGSAMEYQYVPRSYVGLVGRASYNYKSKYLMDVNVGYNGSENFAPGATRFGLFPSGSLGWIISQEGFMQDQELISYLKLRGSYGVVGNDKMGIDRFLYLDGAWGVNGGGYNFGLESTVKDPAANQGSVGNPLITWETATKQNYGVDMKMFDNKLNITADYFHEYRDNILISRKVIPGIVSFEQPKVNMGEVMNHGYELSVRWNDKVGEVGYWVNANVSYSKNKIINMDEPTYPNSFNQQTGLSTGLTYGYEFDRFYSKDDFADVDKGILKDGIPTLGFGTPQPGDNKYVDLDDNGVIDENDKTWLGFSTKRPEYTFGLNHGFSWKGFDLSLQWTGAMNVSRNLSTEYRIPFSPSGNRALFLFHAEGRWTEETAATAIYPRFSDESKGINYDQNSSLWIQDASYIRLKNFQLSYTFSKMDWMKAVGMKNLVLYVSGYNTLTFDKIDFIDPEAPTNGGNSNQYPVAKMYTMGLKVNF